MLKTIMVKTPKPYLLLYCGQSGFFLNKPRINQITFRLYKLNDWH